MFGSVAVLTIKSSSGTQVYTGTYANPFMRGPGLGTFGSVSLDNFITPTTVPPAAVRAASVQPVHVTESNAVDPTLSQ
jgi:hypothetical protein